MFTFTNDCLIGIDEIDEEHRRLFELVASTDEALKTSEDPVGQALLLINELKQYAITHFSHEEKYMESIDDPELPRQKAEHAAFLEKVNAYSFDAVNEDSAKAIILELLEYLSKWLMSHILGSDILIGQFKKNEKPPVPVFSDEFVVGVEIIDEEHKKLFEIVGKIHEAIDADLLHDKFDVILDILGELKDYTQVHFADEENYMREIGYDGLPYQEMLHQKFIDKLNELDLDDVDDNQEEYLYDFLGFLQNWLVNHILRVDKMIPAK